MTLWMYAYESNSKSVDGLDKMIGNRRIMNHITLTN
jgi:hypothetical protein